MVKIRLRRMGAKKAPYYRIVVADSRSPRDGRSVSYTHLDVYKRQAMPRRSTARQAAKLPLSTVETYFGSSGRRVRVSYQLYR